MNSFDNRLVTIAPDGLSSVDIDVLQLNITRRCNLECTHCHLKCGPGRNEEMSKTTMSAIADLAARLKVSKVDITGGAPELNPHFRFLISSLRKSGLPVQARTNLNVLATPKLEGTIKFLHDNEVSLVASMPCYLEENVCAQRGAGIYQKNIKALQELNAVDYGKPGGLPLYLVYNPGGPFLPGSQKKLEADYKNELKKRFNISFTGLYTIANMPIGRFRDILDQEGKTDEYINLLKNSFNDTTVDALMCRRQVCIDWDGTLYDCDFNLALGLTVNHGAPSSLDKFDADMLKCRRIVTGEHCFGCTAGAGSSCGGELI
ncbi:MAG: arsenosugar biosynthesis radical SAM protein ArsS [Desulfobacterales bacterium]|nr:arsenosugar biosynthesis radical SAM protein ArsS [Desulfobacterales bacterium]